MHTLEIKDLTVKIEGKEILSSFSLTINSGEIHAIMGPNGTGKSTLTRVIMGDDSYEIVSGSIHYDGKDITHLPVDERAHLGIFLGMQSPIAIEGVTNADFLRTIVSSKEKKNFKLFPFIKELDATIEKLNMDHDMINRGINQGFSGGERKKSEILQMYLLKPDMVLLDEIDSGLDVDSLKIVGENVTEYQKNSNCGVLLITHYRRLLEYIKPEFVHIMMNGKIVQSGDFSLVDYIEKNGYEKIEKKRVELGTCIVKEITRHE